MRKTLSISITALTLLLSQQSPAEFYIGSKYHGQIASNTGSLKITNSANDIISATKVDDRLAANTEGQLINKYKPNYNPPFSASVVFGRVKQLEQHECRMELEGMYSRVKVGNVGLINGPIVLIYNTEKSDKKEAATYGIVAHHNQIENSSVMANAYHHWKNDQFSFSPYVGAGIGLTRIKMFEKASIRPAYQLKTGLNYQVNKDTDVYIGYRHFGVIGGNFGTFKTLKFDKAGTPTQDNTITTNIKSSFFSTHSVEVGMTVRFAS